jgi:hypothetical protein
VRREVKVSNVNEKLDALEERIAEAESVVRELRRENQKLRAEMTSRGAGAGKSGEDPAPDRSFRLVALEAERDEMKMRLRGLLDAL